MTMRRSKRYSTQSFKKKELIDDPYSMKQAPKGLLECPECHAVFYRKRWSFPAMSSPRVPKSTETGAKTPTKKILIPQSFLCPACRKLRDGYAEGFLKIHWPNWGAHKAEVLGLIHNEEHQAARNNPLERVMTIRTRPDGADIDRWSHKDKCVRIAWQGPSAPTRRTRSAKTPRKKS